MPVKNSCETHIGEVLVAMDGTDVIRCEKCGFAHIDPLPAIEDHKAFYQKAFYETYSQDYIAKHREDSEWWQIEHQEKYEKFEELLEGHRSPLGLLDIGSGPGDFLKTGADRGWRVKGIEPNGRAYLYSAEELRLDVHQAYYNGENASEFGIHDVVHLNNVLEHVVNAVETVMLVRQNLKPSGLISITSPNDFNPLQKVAQSLRQKPPWWVVPEQHINYFNKDSLSGLLKRCGFEIVYITSSFPLELFLLMGEDYIGRHQTGRAVHGRRKKFELAMEQSGQTALKRSIYDALAQLNVGRQITVIGRKTKMGEGAK